MGQGSGQAADSEFDEATTGIMPDHWVTRLHLLRHGEVDEFGRRVVRGQLDVALSAAGRRQSERVAAWLHAVEPALDGVYSSDLARCVELGEFVASAAGVPLDKTDRLREQSMGGWEGQDWKAITESDGPLVTAYWDDYLHTQPPGGESLLNLFERLEVWWRDAAPTARGKRLAVVTHAGPIRALACHLLGVPPAEALRFSPAVASHTSILISEAGAVLETFGERPWLFSGGAG